MRLSWLAFLAVAVCVQALEAPVLLATFHANGVKLHDDGLALLESTKTRVCIISITGRYRSGKSFLWNHLAMVASGEGGAAPEGNRFPVGHTVYPKTDGLYLQKIGVNDDGVTLFLMDSPGLNAPLRDEFFDADAFTLELLLSSVLVFNSLRVIDSRELDSLAHVSYFASKVAGAQLSTRRPKTVEDCLANRHGLVDTSIALTSGGEAAPLDDGALALPRLLWAVRDSTLDIHDGTNPMDATQWLHTILRQSDNIHHRRKERRGSRGSSDGAADVSPALRLCTLFDSFSAVALPPAFASSTPSATDSVTPGFTAAVASMHDDLLQAARPRRIRDVPATGVAMANMARVWAAKISETGSMANTVSEMIDLINGRAVTDALAAYRGAMDAVAQEFPMAVAALNTEHERTLGAAENLFRESSFGNEEDCSPHLARLMAGVGTAFVEMYELKNHQSLDAKFKPLVSTRLLDLEATAKAQLPDFPTSSALVGHVVEDLLESPSTALLADLQEFGLTASSPYFTDFTTRTNALITQLTKANDDASRRECIESVHSFTRVGLDGGMRSVRSITSGVAFVDATEALISERCAGRYLEEGRRILAKTVPSWRLRVEQIILARVRQVQTTLYTLFWTSLLVVPLVLLTRPWYKTYVCVALLASLVLAFLYAVIMTPDVAMRFLVDAPASLGNLVALAYANIVTVCVALVVMVALGFFGGRRQSSSGYFRAY